MSGTYVAWPGRPVSVAFAASGAAALPMVLASSASALPEGRVSADAPAGLIVVRVLASPPTPPLAR